MIARPSNDARQAEHAHGLGGRGAAASRGKKVMLGIVPCRRISWRLLND